MSGGVHNPYDDTDLLADIDEIQASLVVIDANVVLLQADVDVILAAITALPILEETGGEFTTDGTLQTIYINNAPTGVWAPKWFYMDFANHTVTETVRIIVSYRIAPAGPWVIDDRETIVGVPVSAGITIELKENRYGLLITVEKTVDKNITEPMTLADAISKAVTKPIAEAAFVLADTIVKSPGKILADSIAIADAPLKVVGKQPTDTMSISDSFDRTVTFIRPLSDTLAIADTIRKTVVKNIAEGAMTIADTIAKVVEKTLAETLTIADTIAKTVTKAVSDSLTFTDTIRKTVTKAISEAAMTIADSIVTNLVTPGTAWIKNLSDTMAISDSLYGIHTTVQNLRMRVARMNTFRMAVSKMDTMRMNVARMPLVRNIIRRFWA